MNQQGNKGKTGEWTDICTCSHFHEHYFVLLGINIPLLFSTYSSANKYIHMYGDIEYPYSIH